MNVTEQHADINFFEDIEVEVHFIPSMLRNPFTNMRLQRWIRERESMQFCNRNTDGLCVPTLEFDLVYLMVHTYRHIFGEGVGLRQVMDYFFVLCKVSKVSKNRCQEVREKTMKTLKSPHLDGFAAGLMWVQAKIFGLEESRMLCAPNERHGRFILSEIMQTGNMGHFDERLVSMHNASKLKRFVLINLLTLRLLKYYPRETVFSPFSRMCIWTWRKWNGWM